MIFFSKKNKIEELRGRGPWKEAWQTYRKSKTAILGLVIFIIIILATIFAEQIAPYGFDDQNLSKSNIPPGREFIFGTDNYGRDVFSRVVLGAQYSLVIGFVAMTVSAFFGVIFGAVAGFYSDIVDNVIMRFMDLIMAIPNVLLAITIIAMLGNGVENVTLAVGISSIPGYARVIRAAVFSVKDQEFIEAATCIGSSRIRTLFRHVLPNCFAPMIVQMTLSVSAAILLASGLSFIGLGIMPPTPEWGAMLASGRPYIRQYPWIVTFPGIAVMLVIFSISLIGDGLRDALDPKLKR